jgi:hypothetical protein
MGSSSGKAAARVALVAPWQISVNRIGDQWLNWAGSCAQQRLTPLTINAFHR